MTKKKKRINEKNKWRYLIGVIIFVIFVLLGIELGDGLQLDWIETHSPIEEVNLDNLQNVSIKTNRQITKQLLSSNADNLKVYFFDVGQADSILVMNQDKTMLIDAGNNEDGELLVQNLKTLNISKIDYLIGTHPHEDHIGGMDNIINCFEIGTIYMPKVQTNTKTFEDILDAVENKNLKITTPKVDEKFSLGEASCKVLAVGENEKNLNLSSIVIQLDFDGLSYLFTGDSEKEIEDNLKIEKVNVLKVAHHGSNTSSSEKFIKKIAPELAIISVGTENLYGHPNQEVIQRLEQIGSKIYRTDKVGNIFIEQEIKKKQENSEV